MVGATDVDIQGKNWRGEKYVNIFWVKYILGVLLRQQRELISGEGPRPSFLLGDRDLLVCGTLWGLGKTLLVTVWDRFWARPARVEVVVDAAAQPSRNGSEGEQD